MKPHDSSAFFEGVAVVVIADAMARVDWLGDSPAWK